LLSSELQEILIASDAALAEMKTEELNAYVLANIDITKEKLSPIIDVKYHFFSVYQKLPLANQCAVVS
jgi:hypothetical protein